jgi:hypothetical protein
MILILQILALLFLGILLLGILIIVGMTLVAGKLSLTSERWMVSGQVDLLLRLLGLQFRLESGRLELRLRILGLWILFLRRELTRKDVASKSHRKLAKPDRGFRFTVESTQYFWQELGGIDFLRQVRRYLGNSLRVERLQGTFRVGLGDPGVTGQFIGYFYALQGTIPAFRNLELHPEFLKWFFEGDGEVRVGLRMIRLFPLFILIYQKARRLKRKGLYYD